MTEGRVARLNLCLIPMSRRHRGLQGAGTNVRIVGGDRPKGILRGFALNQFRAVSDNSSTSDVSDVVIELGVHEKGRYGMYYRHPHLVTIGELNRILPAYASGRYLVKSSI